MFDAIECMIKDIHKRNQNKIKCFLVTNYAKPGTLIDAKKAYFLVSDDIKSPMGANLYAFSKISKINVKTGKQFNWIEINEYIK